MTRQRIRDPKGVQRSVLRGLKRLARERNSAEFDASIGTVERYVDRDPKPSKTTIYRACQALAKDGKIAMEHTGSRRHPFHFKMVTAEAERPEVLPTEAPVLNLIQQRIDNLMKKLEELSSENQKLTAENESLANEVRMYRDCMVTVNHRLDAIPVAV